MVKMNRRLSCPSSRAEFEKPRGSFHGYRLSKQPNEKNWPHAQNLKFGTHDLRIAPRVSEGIILTG
jgi:hypothetical protein